MLRWTAQIRGAAWMCPDPGEAGNGNGLEIHTLLYLHECMPE